MAGQKDEQRIFPDRIGSGAAGVGMPDRGGKLTVGYNFSVGNPGKGVPDGKLKRRAVGQGCYRKGFPFSGKIFFQLANCLFGDRIRMAFIRRRRYSNAAKLPLVGKDSQDADGTFPILDAHGQPIRKSSA